MKKLTAITLCFIVVGIARSAHTADMRPIDNMLLGAIYVNNPRFVEQDIAGGANVNIRSKIGQTPLIVAASENSSAVIPPLIRAGAFIDAQDIRGTTPLMAAAFWGYEKPIKLLVAYGADIYLRDKHGRTALAVAQEQHHPAVVEYLAGIYKSTLYATLTADKLVPGTDFPPDVIFMVLRPVITASYGFEEER